MQNNKNTRKDFIKKMLFGFGVIIPFSSLLFNKSKTRSYNQNNIKIPNQKFNTISKTEANQILKETKYTTNKRISPKPAPKKKALDKTI